MTFTTLVDLQWRGIVRTFGSSVGAVAVVGVSLPEESASLLQEVGEHALDFNYLYIYIVYIY
jgi:hypothetical protein